MAREEAERTARRQFGNVTLTEERSRGVSAEDPITYITITCAVVMAALQAAEVDPVLALRG